MRFMCIKFLYAVIIIVHSNWRCQHSVRAHEQVRVIYTPDVFSQLHTPPGSRDYGQGRGIRSIVIIIIFIVTKSSYVLGSELWESNFDWLRNIL